MILETGDLEGVPVMLTKALAADYDEWWIEVHLRGGTVRDGYLREADDNEVSIQNEAGDEPWGETLPWSEVAKVVIP